MKTSSKFLSGVPVSPPQYPQSFVSTDRTPLSPNFSESAGPGESPRLIHEADGSPKPIEMMGSTTWSKGRHSQSSLLRHPVHMQMITTAVTEETQRTDQ